MKFRLSTPYWFSQGSHRVVAQCRCTARSLPVQPHHSFCRLSHAAYLPLSDRLMLSNGGDAVQHTQIHTCQTNDSGFEPRVSYAYIICMCVFSYNCIILSVDWILHTPLNQTLTHPHTHTHHFPPLGLSDMTPLHLNGWFNADRLVISVSVCF